MIFSLKKKINKVSSDLYISNLKSLSFAVEAIKSFKEIDDIILELNKFCKKQTSKLPKKLSVLNKLINEKNLARKDCLLLPFITVKKMLKDL